MSVLNTIVRATHCRSTHHYFAMDALPRIRTDSGKRLAQILLRYHDRYLTGAKDPDTRFRDFHNHVVHVNDGYWGGAPAKALDWYQRMQVYLSEKNWSDAAHAAGVLSHYFTDPIQPLHTAQTDREKVIHRPLEWSITKSYDQILRYWDDEKILVQFQLSDRTGWLAAAILHSAQVANRFYTPLVSGYQLEQGVKNPPAGLDEPSRKMLAELFALAITGWSRVLERAAEEAESKLGEQLPKCRLTMPALMATLKIPQRWVLGRIEDRAERQAVAELFKEFQLTGDVVEQEASETRIVRRAVSVHHAERQRLRQITPFAVQTGSSQGSVSSASSTSKTVPDLNGDYLSPEDPIVKAPSIGPKTASRFQAIGLTKVKDLLQADAGSLASQLDARWITADRVADWQAQTQLMCRLPNMRSREVQLLVGSGYRNVEAVAEATCEQLFGAIRQFAAGSEGRRMLRGSSPPRVASVKQWINAAQRISSRQAA